MEVRHLIDTNIFLEVLLCQDKSDVCKEFLNQNFQTVYISNFSLHSIGVILFRYGKYEAYSRFILDVLSKIELISLPKNEYDLVSQISNRYNLDFDDAYQTAIADFSGLQIVTLDNDFKKLAEVYDVFFPA